ncbi:MAG: hypothetical protein JSR99_04965 [Proteobacteria bacterium]|nr:hypothetical protein [Pseudomonadota bacterium]
MRANRILQRGAFTPEEFARLQKTFDTSWAAVSHTVDVADRTRRRETLATIVLSLATARTDMDPQEMSNIAIRLFGIVDEVA